MPSQVSQFMYDHIMVIDEIDSVLALRPSSHHNSTEDQRARELNGAKAASMYPWLGVLPKSVNDGKDLEIQSKVGNP